MQFHPNGHQLATGDRSGNLRYRTLHPTCCCLHVYTCTCQLIWGLCIHVILCDQVTLPPPPPPPPPFVRVYNLEFMDEVVRVEAHDSDVLSIEYSPVFDGECVHVCVHMCRYVCLCLSSTVVTYMYLVTYM